MEIITNYMIYMTDLLGDTRGIFGRDSKLSIKEVILSKKIILDRVIELIHKIRMGLQLDSINHNSQLATATLYFLYRRNYATI